jgi:hypothetical protein
MASDQAEQQEKAGDGQQGAGPAEQRARDPRSGRSNDGEGGLGARGESRGCHERPESRPALDGRVPPQLGGQRQAHEGNARGGHAEQRTLPGCVLPRGQPGHQAGSAEQHGPEQPQQALDHLRHGLLVGPPEEPVNQRIPAEQVDELQAVETGGEPVREIDEAGLRHEDAPGDGRREHPKHLGADQHAALGEEDIGAHEGVDEGHDPGPQRWIEECGDHCPIIMPIQSAG